MSASPGSAAAPSSPHRDASGTDAGLRGSARRSGTRRRWSATETRKPIIAASATVGRASSPAPHTSSLGGGSSTSLNRRRAPSVSKRERPLASAADARRTTSAWSAAVSGPCPAARPRAARARRRRLCRRPDRRRRRPASPARTAHRRRATRARPPRHHRQPPRRRGDRLHQDVDLAVTAEPQAPELALIGAGVVVQEAARAGVQHAEADLAHVLLETAAADAAEKAAARLDQQLGARTPVGRAADLRHHGQRGASPLPPESEDAVQDMRHLLPVLQIESPRPPARARRENHERSEGSEAQRTDTGKRRSRSERFRLTVHSPGTPAVLRCQYDRRRRRKRAVRGRPRRAVPARAGARRLPGAGAAGPRPPAGISGQRRDHADAGGGDRRRAAFGRADRANVHRGVHTLSERATAAYEAARGAVQRFINAREANEIVFVRGTTEAIMVAHSFGRTAVAPGDEVLVTAGAPPTGPRQAAPNARPTAGGAGHRGGRAALR